MLSLCLHFDLYWKHLVSVLVPEEAPSGVTVTVMNSTVRVKWNEAQNVRGLLLGYKVPLREEL